MDPDSSAIMGLVERRDSAIKAVSSVEIQHMDVGEAEVEQVVIQRPQSQQDVLLPSLAGPAPERMMVISAGGLGKSSGKLQTPRCTSKKSDRHARTPSGAISIDIVARTNSRTPARELDRLHVENRAPPRFICPINGRIMRDPVILGTGTTCDRGSLERYLAKGHKRCPVTKRPLKKPIHTTPNIELRQNIVAWAKRNAPWLLDRDGQLKLNEPDLAELQGKDPQYVTPLADEEAPAAGNSMGRIESRKSSWKFTNGSKVRPGAINYDINASAGGRSGSGAVGAAAVSPWETNRGIASAPRSRRSRSSSPSKRAKNTRDWYSTGFLGVISLATLLLFIMSLMKNSWKMEPLSINPWFGPSAEALTAVGAQALPLMEGSGKSYWRLFSSIFLPAGAIHFGSALLGLWIYGRYAQMALPLPQVSVAGVYLLSGLVGAMVSANLNAYYVSCGAFAGVLGLLGTVCADQMLNFATKKLFNLKEWWIVSFILLLNAGGLITASLLPMSGIWYSAAAFLAGFLLSVGLLVIPRVGRDKPGNMKWASSQIVCALLLVGGFTAAVIGVAMPTKLGESQPFLKTASCLDFGSMDCVPYGFLPNGCGVTLATSNSSETSNMLTCPQPTNTTIPLPDDAQFTYGDAASTEALCTQYCADAEAAFAPGAAPTTEIIIPADAEIIIPSISMTPPASTPTMIMPSTTPTTAIPAAPSTPATPAADSTTPVEDSVPNLNLPADGGLDVVGAVQDTLDIAGDLINGGRKLRAGTRQ